MITDEELEIELERWRNDEVRGLKAVANIISEGKFDEKIREGRNEKKNRV